MLDGKVYEQNEIEFLPVNAENAAAYAAAGAVILVTSWPYWGRPRDVKMTFAREA